MVLSTASVFSSAEEGREESVSELPAITWPLNLTPPLSPHGMVSPALQQQRRHSNIDRDKRQHAGVSTRSNVVVTKDTSRWQYTTNSAGKVGW